MTDSIFKSDLWSDKTLVRSVVEIHCLKTLVEKIGIEKILKRVPDNYLQSILSSWLASHFIYEYGLHADEIDFHTYLRRFSC